MEIPCINKVILSYLILSYLILSYLILSYLILSYLILSYLFVPGGVLPEKLGGGVQPAFQNPYPIYDQDLRYSLPFYDETLFMT